MFIFYRNWCEAPRRLFVFAFRAIFCLFLTSVREALLRLCVSTMLAMFSTLNELSRWLLVTFVPRLFAIQVRILFIFVISMLYQTGMSTFFATCLTESIESLDTLVHNEVKLLSVE